MPSKKTHDVVATVGEYESQGQKKKRYVNCGSAFTDETGRISIKLDSVPVSPEWSGWLSLFEPKQNESKPFSKPLPPEGQTRPAQGGRKPSLPSQDVGSFPLSEDEIPFAPPHYLEVGGW